jgi:hypothetical protein
MAKSNFKSREGLARPAKLALGGTRREKAVEPDPRSVPSQLSGLDYWAALHTFKCADCDGNNSLELNEFTRFLSTNFQADMWWIDAPKLFSSIDKDESGALDIEEFFAWVYSVRTNAVRARDRVSKREIQRSSSTPGLASGLLSPKSPLSPFGSSNSTACPLSPKSPGSRGSLTPLSPKSPTSPGSRSQGALRRTGGAISAQPSEGEKSLVIDITYGPDFDLGVVPNRIGTLEHIVKERMGNRVTLRKSLDPKARGMSRVRACLGVGINIWVQDKMMMFRDDPFVDAHSTENWARLMCDKHFPLLLRIMNL